MGAGRPGAGDVRHHGQQLGTTVSGVNDLVTGRLAGGAAGAHDMDGGVTTIPSPAITLPATGTLTLSLLLLPGAPQQLVQRGLPAGLRGRQHDHAGVPGAGRRRHRRRGLGHGQRVNISAFAGQTVRIRIEAADASTASLVEAAVDDVRITQQ